MKRKNKNGQASSIDFFAGLSIFFVLLIISVIILSNYTGKAYEKIEYHNMVTKAYQISDVLIKDGGYPIDWDKDNVELIGLASEDRILSETKINEFTSLSMNEIKEIFKIYDYDFYFLLNKTTGENIAEHGNIPEGNKIVNVGRYVRYNNEDAVLEFSIWK